MMLAPSRFREKTKKMGFLRVFHGNCRRNRKEANGKAFAASGRREGAI
jgi:hypothetical protein